MEETTPKAKPRKKTKMTVKSIPTDKYLRGGRASTKGLHDKKLRAQLRDEENQYEEVAKRAAWRELLLPEEAGGVEAEGIEKTYQFQQKHICSAVDFASAQKGYQLSLKQFGPYSMDYTRDGRFLLLGGQKGHLAAMDWQSQKLLCEVNVNETVRCVRFLHIHNMFAVAQKKSVFIYDDTGAEMHCLHKHPVMSMEYLPYHFLLATAGSNGHLCYQDTSTGRLVADHNVRLGRLSCMTQNPRNAVIHLGHQNGVVSLWTPSSGKPQVSMLTHTGAVISLAIDRSGNYMATGGLDGQLRVWDLRTYKTLHTYHTPQPARSLSISQRGLLAAGCTTDIRVWRDCLGSYSSSTYLHHHFSGQQLSEVQFCPYEDVLGVGHSAGFTSLLVPGAGEANFDALEHNPFATKKQRQEKEVKQLLEKIQPELITVDTSSVQHLVKSSQAQDEDDEEETVRDHFRPRHRTKGRSSAANRHRRIQSVRDQERRERIHKA